MNRCMYTYSYHAHAWPESMPKDVTQALQHLKFTQLTVREGSNWPSERSNSMYMLLLTGQGDTNVSIVDQQVWDWVNDPWGKEVPDVVVDGAMKPEFNTTGQSREETAAGLKGSITVGSPENDAALSAMCYLDYYWSLKEALDHIKANNIDIEDTFEGYIY